MAKALSFVFLFLLKLGLSAQVSNTIFTHNSDDLSLEQVLLVDNQTILALARGDGQFKLVNTVLLIRNQKIIDKYVHKTTLDYIHKISNNSFLAFQPTNAEYELIIKDDSILVSEKIRVRYNKTIWSTDNKEQLLVSFDGLTILFDQGDRLGSFNKRDDKSFPNYFLFRDDVKTRIVPNYKFKSSHWPTTGQYSRAAHNYIRITPNRIYFPISNLNTLYWYNTGSESIDYSEFPKIQNIQTWSWFYDHEKNQGHFVGYLGNDIFHFFLHKNGKLERIAELKGFIDSIAGGHVLTKNKDGKSIEYSVFKLEKL